MKSGPTTSIFTNRPPTAGLVFGWRGKLMTTVPRRPLATVAARAGLDPKLVTPKVCRHTYCSTRLQSLDQGHPVIEFTVQREMGHSSGEMIREIYGHLGHIRHRTEGVEYLPASAVSQPAVSQP